MKSKIMNMQFAEPQVQRKISMEEELQAHVDMAESSVNVEKQINEIDQAEDLVDALESLIVVCDQIDKPTSTETALIDLVGQSVVAGSDAQPDEIVPALESEEQKSGFLQKTRETILRLIKAIKDAFARAWQWVTKFFSSLTTVVNARALRTKEIQKRLEKVNFKGPISVEIPKNHYFTKNVTGQEIIKNFSDDYKRLEKYLDICKKVTDSFDKEELLRVDEKTGKITIVAKGIPGLGSATESEQITPGLYCKTYRLHLEDFGITTKINVLEGTGNFDTLTEAKTVLVQWASRFTAYHDKREYKEEYKSPEGHRIEAKFNSKNELLKCLSLVEMYDNLLTELGDVVFNKGGDKLTKLIEKTEDGAKPFVPSVVVTYRVGDKEYSSADNLKYSSTFVRSMGLSSTQVMNSASRVNTLLQSIVDRVTRQLDEMPEK